MFEANTMEFFQGVSEHFLVHATAIRKIVQLVFGMELPTMYSLPEAGSDHKVTFRAS